MTVSQLSAAALIYSHTATKLLIVITAEHCSHIHYMHRSHLLSLLVWQNCIMKAKIHPTWNRYIGPHIATEIGYTMSLVIRRMISLDLAQLYL